MNIALKRDANQSSTYEKTQASNAVDGETDCLMMAHAAVGDANRWWIVNFGQSAVVQGISIFNKNTCGLY